MAPSLPTRALAGGPWEAIEDPQLLEMHALAKHGGVAAALGGAWAVLLVVGCGAERPKEEPSPPYLLRVGMTAYEASEAVGGRPTPLYSTSAISVNRGFLKLHGLHPSREQMQREVLFDLYFREQRITARFNFYGRLIDLESYAGDAMARVETPPQASLAPAGGGAETYRLGMTVGEVIEITQGSYDTWYAPAYELSDVPFTPLEMRRQMVLDIGLDKSDVWLCFNRYGELIRIFHPDGKHARTLIAASVGIAAVLAALGVRFVIRRRTAVEPSGDRTLDDGKE